MRRAALAIAIALTIASPAATQGVNPAPGASPGPGAAASPPVNPRRNANPAQALPPPESISASCDQGFAADVRKCKAKNLAILQKALNRKIAEACQKHSGAGRGGPAADERLACRFDMMIKLMQSIN